MVGFKKFHHQFRNYLIEDSTDDGKPKQEVEQEIRSLDLRLNETYRFVIGQDNVQDVRAVYSFPDDLFKRQDFIYDKEGNVMYRDGGYTRAAWDKPFHYGPFDYFSYVRVHGGLSPQYLSNHKLTLRIVLNDKGKALKIRILDNSDPLSKDQLKALEKAILEMPALNVPTIHGKPVSFGIDMGLGK